MRYPTCFLLLFLFFEIGVCLTGHSKGSLEIFARQLNYRQKKGRLILLHDVKLTYVPTQSILYADRIEIEWKSSFEKTNYAIAEGNVKYTGKNLTFMSNSLIYDKKSQQLTAQGKINIKGLQFQLESDYIKHDLERKETLIQSFGSRLVLLKILKGKTGFSDARQVIAVQSKNIRFFHDRLKLKLKEQALIETSSENYKIKADQLEIIFDNEKNLEHILANGNVVISQTGRIANSNEVEIDLQKKVVTLKGNAVIKQENNLEVRGEILEIYLDVQKGFVKGSQESPLRIRIPINQ